MSQDINLKNILPALKESSQKITRYTGILFFCLVAGVYIFVLFRINQLASAQPDPNAAQITTQQLRVNEDIADQLLQLEDNSVNVQSLFNEARNDPFQ